MGLVGADGMRSRLARDVGARVVEQHPTDNSTFYAPLVSLGWRWASFGFIFASCLLAHSAT